jgi:hypothetical protein
LETQLFSNKLITTGASVDKFFGGGTRPPEISIARSLLSSGRYTVVVRNAAEPGKPKMQQLARCPFTLKLD